MSRVSGPPDRLTKEPHRGTEVHHFLREMSFTIITSSISDYWESFAPAANHNSNRRISSDFCSLKRIILCIHYSRGGLWNLQQTKKSKTLSYAFHKKEEISSFPETDRLKADKTPNCPKTGTVSHTNVTILFQGNGWWRRFIRRQSCDLWIIVGFPSFYPQSNIWWSWLAFTQL